MSASYEKLITFEEPISFCESRKKEIKPLSEKDISELTEYILEEKKKLDSKYDEYVKMVSDAQGMYANLRKKLDSFYFGWTGGEIPLATTNLVKTLEYEIDQTCPDHLIRLRLFCVELILKIVSNG